MGYIVWYVRQLAGALLIDDDDDGPPPPPPDPEPLPSLDFNAIEEWLRAQSLLERNSDA